MRCIIYIRESDAERVEKLFPHLTTSVYEARKVVGSSRRYVLKAGDFTKEDKIVLKIASPKALYVEVP